MGVRRAVREGFLEEVVCELPLEEGTRGRVAWRFAFRSGVYGMDRQGGWLGRFRAVMIRVDWTLTSATEQQWAMRPTPRVLGLYKGANPSTYS